ncbi:MAG TPA: glutathione peroxidase [Phycisphaerales bacterium]|nr:glutathione peroxidase [Phycisphaerales bacterium]
MNVETSPDAYVLDHTLHRITGERESLEKYKGKVILMVNVASKCGYTPQYEQLEAIYRQYKDDGFVVLGFPANNFRGQEPGSNEEILEFCTEKFDVTFPMFEKIEVIGEETNPLYLDLAGQPEPIGGPPEWNFTKFLVDRDGNVVARFDTKVRPDDEKVIRKIEELIAAEPSSD